MMHGKKNIKLPILLLFSLGRTYAAFIVLKLWNFFYQNWQEPEF